MESLNERDVTVKIYLTSDLRARFKAKCALQEKSMNEVLLSFIHDFIDEPLLPTQDKEVNGKKVSSSPVS